MFQRVQDFPGDGFGALALDVFRFQAAHNELYARYISLLNVDIQRVTATSDIPFLPISFFKNYAVKTGHWQEQAVFTSSGTTGETTSRHYVRDLDFYKKNTVHGFRQFYGDPAKYLVLALLPSYLERTGSSLVVMAGHFIQLSRHPQSGFFLQNFDPLIQILRNPKSEIRNRKTLLLGVSFALLDLAERYPVDLQHVIIMETGGMKGRRREMTRTELHESLKTAFHTPAIHSEYGMTELLSQAYSAGEGKFSPAPTLRAFTREITDPLTLQATGKTGILNLIDLANFDTCSFIATDDLGRVWPDGSFEVLGRADNSDVRGCNLMV
ncbi:MAG: acyl transferase [Bacteroidetes bacterium]|nr:acyl transferase [Bacteroidota bacterium]